MIQHAYRFAEGQALRIEVAVPQTRADVASKATGRLQTLEVVEGSVVKKDQVIARLESADVEAAARIVDELAADLGLARR